MIRTCWTVFLAASLTVGALHAQKDKKYELSRAADLLKSGSEGDVREGAKICADLNSVEAVELLLKVLNMIPTTGRRGFLAPGHYRDVAWEGLIEITDFYAQLRVEEELKRSSRNPWVRQWCAELLGIYGRLEFAKSLEKATRDKDPNVVRWAARSLGMLKGNEGLTSLQKLIRKKNKYVRANAIEALARLAPEEHLEAFVLAISDDKEGGVRCALLGAVPEVCADQAEKLSVAALSDDDWRPRFQAVENLESIRTKTAVDGLIRALADGRPAVMNRAQRSLRKSTGKPHNRPDIWKNWWADNRETFVFPSEEDGAAEKSDKPGDAPGTVAYLGIPLTSDHVAFLIDRSFEMGRFLKSKSMNKDEAALAELGNVLERLQELTFNVHTYHEEVKSLAKKPLTLTKRAHKAALAFVSGVEIGRRKDIWQVLETVLADETLDTAYLLSSGEPDQGLYVHWNRVTRHLADLNRFHKVTVHTVAYSESKWYRDQLEHIAKVTGGEFRWYE